MEKIIAIDYSFNCPAVCILGADHSFNTSQFHYLINTKKYVGKFNNNIFGYQHKPYKNSMERYENLAKWVFEVAEPTKDSVVFLEDYALGAKGLTWNIAENTAILKYFLHINSIEVITVPPTIIKKFAVKGNASKEDMYQAFLKLTGVNLIDMFEVKGKLSNPITDIVDAYFIGLYGYECRKDTGKR